MRRERNGHSGLSGHCGQTRTTWHDARSPGKRYSCPLAPWVRFTRSAHSPHSPHSSRKSAAKRERPEVPRTDTEKTEDAHYKAWSQMKEESPASRVMGLVSAQMSEMSEMSESSENRVSVLPSHPYSGLNPVQFLLLADTSYFPRAERTVLETCFPLLAKSNIAMHELALLTER